LTWNDPEVNFKISFRLLISFQCQQLEAKLTDSQLWSEFERIPKRKDNAKFECALHEENASRNLDPKYLPYDDNRVRITPSRDNRMGYVNASYVTVGDRERETKRFLLIFVTNSFCVNLQSTVGTKQRFYIAAQTPHNSMASTSFWQGVWETDIYLLVQLSDEVKYVPPNSERFLEYGQVSVMFCGVFT
jgi:tyrosine-protein phosphatase non-receptor type 14/21